MYWTARCRLMYSATLPFVFLVTASSTHFATDIAESPEIARNIVTVDGHKVTLGCNTTGQPKNKHEHGVKWTKNHVELTGGQYSIAENGDLIISKVDFTGIGNYTCTATNSYGTTNVTRTLIVKNSTRVTVQPKLLEVAVGSAAVFLCQTSADISSRPNVEWTMKNETIHFNGKHRFNFRANDNSMTIDKTKMSDTGTYTCLARTDLDEAADNAMLVVQDKPNPPELFDTVCGKRNAHLKWRSTGDNNAPIQRYIVQNIESVYDHGHNLAYVSVTSEPIQTYTVPVRPWSNYTFRVIAKNKIGRSNPSFENFCSTDPDVPYSNPENVKAAGTEPTNLVISWKPMPRTEYNAPGFRYRVYWKLDATDQNWSSEEITDPTKNEFVVCNRSTYQRHRVKVIASNDLGDCRAPQKEIIGYSGEDVPDESPQNLTVLNVTGHRSAMLSWKPVSLESINGNFKGYLIKIWSEIDGKNYTIEEHINSNKTTVEITNLIPNSKYMVYIHAHNNRFNGPSSQLIRFCTPEEGTGNGKFENMVKSGWFIAMSLAVLFLVLIIVLLIVSVAKHNRGAKHVDQLTEVHGVRSDEHHCPDRSQSAKSLNDDNKQSTELDTVSTIKDTEMDTGNMVHTF